MRYLIFVLLLSTAAFSQVPAIEPGVSQELAKWRAAHYSDVRYKLNLTLEKMSPVLKGTMEIKVNVSAGTQAPSPANAGSSGVTKVPIILDWRKIRGSESLSTIFKVSLNGVALSPPSGDADKSVGAPFEETNEHLIFRDGVVVGENVIKLDFTSPILTSGSAITRYIDKEDGSEYIYSLFVPSDASTAFPVFDQPDLKARFQLNVVAPNEWKIVSNGYLKYERECFVPLNSDQKVDCRIPEGSQDIGFSETKPISTYVFAFAAGPFERVSEPTALAGGQSGGPSNWPAADAAGSDRTSIYVRKSQAAKFQPHAAEVFRLNREAVKYFEDYFNYKFPFPKYDLVLIPEFPFGGMEHAGATFLRESAIIFPQEPTKSDHISRATLIFHETAHQWFGDTVTMKWFDDLWLKEGFANFMAYKAVDKIMPDANAWKVFYERIKQPAYATDSTRGTTPIYQPIENLNSAKSAYGNIVYNKAPAFLKQAEFYLGENKSFGVRDDKFQTAVRAFLKKYEYKNATFGDLVTEFEIAKGKDLKGWANRWIKQPGVPVIRLERKEDSDGRLFFGYSLSQSNQLDRNLSWAQYVLVLESFKKNSRSSDIYQTNVFDPDIVNPQVDNRNKFVERAVQVIRSHETIRPDFLFSNHQDYGYGIFLLDDKSREYVLKNVQNEKDAFLRSMMYGALWDSVREGELDPRTYVDIVIKNLPTEQDETIAQMMTSRTATAFIYYIDKGRNPSGSEGAPQGASTPKGTLPTGRVSASIAAFESVLIERIKNAPTIGQRITFFRTLVANATTESSRSVLKAMLKGGNLSGSEGAPQGSSAPKGTLPTGRVSAFVIRAKDKFDIVTRLAVLNDPDAASLLAELEKTETSDDAKRYAYAARAAFPTKENREKFWNDFVANKDISESWIEAAVGPFNSVRNSELSLPYLERALRELPNLKRSRKIFFVNNWLGAFIGGQRSEAALNIVNKFLADNPNLDRDLRLKILENVDIIERAVKIRAKYGSN